MAYADVQLNGSADYLGRITMNLTSQNQGGNYSTFYWQSELIKNYGGSGYWSNSASYWSTSYGSGSFTIPSNTAGYGSRVLGNGYVDIGHDGAGYRPAFANNGSWNVQPSQIGSGSVDVWVDAPRIPKRPSQPGTPTFSGLGTDQVTVSWSGSGDDGGSGIDAYLLRCWTGPSAAGSYSDSYQGNLSRVVTGLTPGQTYTFGVYAHNGSADNGGYSDASPLATVTMLAGVYISDGTNWIAAGLKVSDGSAWGDYVPKDSDGSTWIQPT